MGIYGIFNQHSKMAAKPIQIFVSTPSGTPRHIAVNIVPGETTGFELAQLVTDRIGGKPEWLRFMYAGRSIENNDIVTDKKVGAENTVHALMRILSCQECPQCEPANNLEKQVPSMSIESNSNN